MNNEADGTIFDVTTCNLLKENIDIVILFGKKYIEQAVAELGQAQVKFS